jgi:hypothetical protein
VLAQLHRSEEQARDENGGAWRTLIRADRGCFHRLTSRRVERALNVQHQQTRHRNQHIDVQECLPLLLLKLEAAPNDPVLAVAGPSRAPQHPCDPPRDLLCASLGKQALAAQQMLLSRLLSLHLQNYRIRWLIWRPILCICS